MREQQKILIRRILMWSLLIADALLCLCTLFSAYGGVFDPRTTVVAPLAAMVFPIMILLTIVVGGAICIWNWRPALANLATIILCLGPIFTLFPVHMFRPSVDTLEQMRDDGEVIKVMTYNVMGYSDMDGTYDVTLGYNPTVSSILAQDADIVACQESIMPGYRLPVNVSDEQIDSLNKRYPYQHETMRGMRLWSRFPFEVVDVPVTGSDSFDVCRYDINVMGETLHLFNLHLQSLGLNDDDKEIYMHLTEGETSDGMDNVRHNLLHKFAAAQRQRAGQANEIADAIDNLDSDRVLVVGDFNDIPGSYATRTLEKRGHLTDGYRVAGNGPSITYRANRFYFRIDHMMTGDGVEPLRIDKIGCESSDHYPLVGYFRIK